MKIDKSKLMRKAWRIARKAVKNFGGKVREYFNRALREAWAIMKNKNIDLEKLKKLADRVKVSALCKTTTLFFDNLENYGGTRYEWARFDTLTKTWEFDARIKRSAAGIIKQNILASI